VADDGRPGDSTALAADDMIGSLAGQVRELSLRVAQLQGELEAARRRIAVYEDFDTQVQDSLSAALRAANQIRERARVSAEAMAVEARAQKPEISHEVEALRVERDTLRRAIEDASKNASSRQATSAPQPFASSELRTAATEALRGVFKELVEEMRASTPPPAPAAAAPPPPAPSPEYSAPAPAVERPAATIPPAAPAVTPTVTAPPPAAAQSTPFDLPRPTPAAPPPPAPAPQATPYPFPSLVEDEEFPSSRHSAAPAAEPAAPAEQWPGAATEPVGEIQLVLSPIASFPRLVELERRLQGMPVVRTVYARDFRNGVATLAIGLRHPMTVGEFASAVTSLEYPRSRVLSATGFVLELRIEPEASSIA
jgi:hypothetical protein